MNRSPAINLLLGLSFLFIVLLVALPFWWVFSGSFKLPQEIIARSPTFFPHSFTLDHYIRLIARSAYATYVVNSLIVALFSTLFTLLIAVPAAYAFFRMEFPGRETIYRIILLAYAFPSIVVLIPLFGMLAKIGMIDTLPALMLVNVTFALPFSIWMLRSFFASVPKEIEEAAIMDGAGPVTLLRRVMIPLIAPGIASVGIFAFISSWTEYVFASVLIISDVKRTVPVGFSGIIGQYQIDWGLLLAGAGLAVLPVIILFAFIGRWFVSGLTEGAVK
ncbi:carbohydrate ABC transporter permease [Rhizobium alvei]|uniref:Maltose/maltodextrin transport system permease protein MalG n=1 Tax=Rhizobium alvei TaxID=1132659 RepID=A0ABT8YI58_9HYPH|nr:carbohydrate ABC transporter permease [Rhizobium alvei]MDO6963379.1 carbohydrate ABC transporter permease [Rhizobium alvei]